MGHCSGPHHLEGTNFFISPPYVRTFKLLWSTRNMTNTNYVVYQGLQQVLGTYCFGLSVCRLPLLERSYLLEFRRPLDYKSLGVSNIEDLVVKMGNMVLWCEKRESKEKSVMSAIMVECRRKIFLKHEVKKLLNRHRGEIVFNSFEDLYEDEFQEKLDYDYYGLTNLKHLCEILKDILVVGVANPSGEKVIKGVNLRKRKRDEELE
ncbi:hypothetical protein CTI12_AA631220 [Artemisia annua]|uniref:HTH OST-type domain-containing protein n=1 Tax=Artemisia annua TaxID=35608 RepID=A0A2U1K8Q9_ARTAN|nr:hypothetical protein CTI12_AA631220 [Artemisia annua]